MADPDHLEILKQGVAAWNRWRSDNVQVMPNLTHGFFVGIHREVKNGPPRPLMKGERGRLAGINFSGANLREANFEFVDLDGANLLGADLEGANLQHVNLSNACLDGANLKDANLKSAMLNGASLVGANLMRATLVGTDLRGTNLADCNIFGISAWNVQTDESTNQSRLRIANYNEPEFQAPSLEIAQFVYLLLKHRNLRAVISAVVDRGVLILGRFSPERKEVLNAVADRLIKLGYLPLLFDFERVQGMDYTETIMTLAGLARFVLADISQPRSVQQEAHAIIPNFQRPFIAFLQNGEEPWSMFGDLMKHPWVSRDVRGYTEIGSLLDELPRMIDEAEEIRERLLAGLTGPKIVVRSIEKGTGIIAGRE